VNLLTAFLRKYLGWNALVEISKMKGFPGHRGLSVYEVISFLWIEIQRDSILTRTSSIAFSFFISLFPTMLVFFTLIPYIPVPTFQPTLLITLRDVLPANVYGLFDETIHDIVTRPRGGLLSISLILAIYYSSRGVIGMMNSFDKALPTFRKRNYINRQLVAFKIVGLLFLLLAISVTLFIGGEAVVKWLMKRMDAETSTAYFWFTALRLVSIIFIFYFSIAMIYYFGPATHKRWRFFSAGSTLATILSILSSVIFSWTIDQVGQYNKLYGSIGTLIVLMLWIYYNSMSLLIGFELNASIEMNKAMMQKGKRANASA
jgi:membrane protein